LFPSLHPESQGTNLNHGNRKAGCPLKNELVSLAISCENVLEPTTDLVVGVRIQVLTIISAVQMARWPLKFN
jgi:hypothetical protein